jgi:hypothetical protein
MSRNPYCSDHHVEPTLVIEITLGSHANYLEYGIHEGRRPIAWSDRQPNRKHQSLYIKNKQQQMRTRLLLSLIILWLSSCHNKPTLQTYTFEALLKEQNTLSDSFAIEMSNSRHPLEARALKEQQASLPAPSSQSLQMTAIERDGKVLIRFQPPKGYRIEKSSHQDTIFLKPVPVTEKASADGFCVIKIVDNNAYCYRGNCKMTRNCVMYKESAESRNCVCEGEPEPVPEPTDPWPYPIPPINGEDPYEAARKAEH